MRIFNMLKLKNRIKVKLGIAHLTSRVDELLVEKVSFHRFYALLEELETLKQEIRSLQAASGSLERPLSPPKKQILDNSKQQFIFVCGLHRSGTTLFTKLLQRHKAIFGFEDTEAIQDEGQFLQTVYPPDSVLGWPGSFGFNREAHLTEASRLVTQKNRDKMLRQWSYHLVQSGSVFVEKSPGNILRTRFLQALFPNSYFVILKRHPVAVAMATKKWTASSELALIRHWLRCYRIWEADRAHIRRFVEIRYEDFVQAPLQTMKEVARNVGLRWDETTLREGGTDMTVRADVNKNYFAQWKKRPFQRVGSFIFYRRAIAELGYDETLSS